MKVASQLLLKSFSQKYCCPFQGQMCGYPQTTLSQVKAMTDTLAYYALVQHSWSKNIYSLGIKKCDVRSKTKAFFVFVPKKLTLF